MTYNEWRDELKNNLLSVTESERNRVLDYYAEAYADRREAGFSEREIIEDFGAPYDAAQRILCDADSYYEEVGQQPIQEKEQKREKRHCCDHESRRREHERRTEYTEQEVSEKPAKNDETRDDLTWLFVLLCIIFAVPLFIAVMAMVGVSVGVCVAPFAILVSGFATIGAGIGEMFSDVADGFMSVGVGLMAVGLSIILIPLCIKLVKLMWKLFKKFFRWIRSLFGGRKECVK